MAELIGTIPQDVAADFRDDSMHVKPQTHGSYQEVIVDGAVRTAWVPEWPTLEQMQSKGDIYLKTYPGAEALIYELAHPDTSNMRPAPDEKDLLQGGGHVLGSWWEDFK